MSAIEQIQTLIAGMSFAEKLSLNEALAWVGARGEGGAGGTLGG
jgi:hypothetical protein